MEPRPANHNDSFRHCFFCWVKPDIAMYFYGMINHCADFTTFADFPNIQQENLLFTKELLIQNALVIGVTT